MSPSVLTHPQEENEPVFQAPWEARAFAIVNQLVTGELCSWPEWTEQFASEISVSETDPTDASSYYERWVKTCEQLLVAKGILDVQSIEQRCNELLIEQSKDHVHDGD